MRRPTLATLLTVLLLTTALAGCIGDDGGGDAPAERSLDLSGHEESSERTAARVGAVSGGLVYGDLRVLVNGEVHTFAEAAQHDPPRFEVPGRSDAADLVTAGDRLVVPAAGFVTVEVRDADGGELLARYDADVPDDDAPGIPANRAPADEATGVDREPVFRWSSVQDPSGITYTLEIALDPSFQDPLVVREHRNITATNFALGGGQALLPGQTYHWHVRAVDGAGNAGAWSTTWSFTAEAAP